MATSGGAPPVKRLEEDSLSGLDWTPDGKSITYLSARSGSLQLWRLPADGGAAELVFSHAPGPEETVMRRGYHPGDKTEVGVLSYRFSPSGKQIAFAAPGRSDPEKNKELARRGILYDDESMSVQSILNDSWRHEPTGLWIYDIGAKTEKKVWQTPDEISGFAWSPDGARLAVSYAAPPLQKTTMIFFNQDLGILTLADGKFRVVSATEAVEQYPVWSPDGKSLAFESSLSEANTSIVVLDPATGARRDLARGEIGVGGVRDLWWDRDRLLMELPTRGRARVGKSAIWSVPAAGGALKKVSSGDESLSACAIAPGAADAVCIRQASMIPPDPALVHLADGSVRTLARINPELEGVKLSPIRELRWKNKYGDETNGYLIDPPARPAPLLVILYGFSGDFVEEAEWIASYPAQAFARDGFAVLMMNYPRYQDWEGHNYAKGSVAEGLSPLASMDAAVRMLAQQGIADPKRTGVLGWSYGCFLSEFAITHSDLFRVASAGAGGDYNPGIYSLLGKRALRENYERVLGGPPYDDTPEELAGVLSGLQRESDEGARAHGVFSPRGALRARDVGGFPPPRRAGRVRGLSGRGPHLHATRAPLLLDAAQPRLVQLLAPGQTAAGRRRRHEAAVRPLERDAPAHAGKREENAMTSRIRVLNALGAAVFIAAGSVAAAAQRPLIPDDLMRLEEVGDAAFSPDGKWLAYVVKRSKKTTFHKWDFLNGGDRGDVWLVSANANGGQPKNLTNGASDGAGFWMPRWSPGGDRIAMLSSRGDNVGLWVWEKSSGRLSRLSDRGIEPFNIGASGPVWISEHEIVCPVLPPGRKSSALDVEVRSGVAAMREWQKAWKGDQVTASELDSGVPVLAKNLPQGELLRLDASGPARSIATAPSFHDVRLSPDGKRVAFLRQSGVRVPESGKAIPHTGTDLLQLGIASTAPASDIRDTDVREVFTGGVKWSPDSARVAVVGYPAKSDKSGPQVFLCGVDGSCQSATGPEIDPGPPNYGGIELVWTAKGVLFVCAKSNAPELPADKADRRDWWRVAPGSAPVNATAEMKAPPGSLIPMPDGSLLGVADGDLWRIDPNATGAKNLTDKFDPKITSILFPKESSPISADLKRVLVGVTLDRVTDIYSVDLATSAVTAVAKPDKEAKLEEFDPKTGMSVFSGSSRSGTSLWLGSAQGRFTTVVETNKFLRDIAEGTPKKIEYRGLDGQDLKAWIILPVGYQEGKKYPMVTWVYAGSMAGETPTSLANLNFAIALNLQLLAAHGYAVLIPSMPLKPESVASDPYMDLTKGVLPAVDKAVELGIADGKRLGLIGQSYGGFSTYGLVTQTTRFQAAVSLAGLSDLTALYSQFDARYRYEDRPQDNLFYFSIAESAQERLGNPPWKDFGRYLRNSPIFYVDRVETPLMIIQGDMDYVAIQQGEEFFMSLYRQKKRASFVRYWGEGHVLEGPANIRDMWKRIYGWFDEFLVAPPEPEPAAVKSGGQ